MLIQKCPLAGTKSKYIHERSEGVEANQMQERYWYGVGNRGVEALYQQPKFVGLEEGVRMKCAMKFG